MTLPPRTVALIGTVCLTVGWLLASTLTPPVAQLQSRPERQAKPAPSTEQAGFTEQLHWRLQRVPQPPAPRRNPFMFAQRPRPGAQAPAASGGAPAKVDDAPAPAVALGPVFSLSGIGISGTTRTAILSEGQDVHVVKIGDRVGNYDIVDITDNSVTLGEASGLRYVLRLR